MKFQSLIFIVLLSVCACTHSDPIDEDWCLDPSYQIPFDIKVRVDDSFYHYTTIDSTNLELATRTRVTRGSESWRLQYYVAAYNKESTKDPLSVFVSTDSVVPVQLHPGKYTIAAWADYVPQTQSRSHFYNLDDFYEIMLKNKINYESDEPFKVPYHGTKPIKVSYNLKEAVVNTTPAMGMFRLVPNDSATYEIGKVVVTYLSQIPAALDGFTGDIAYKWSDVSFETMPKGDILVQDYILGPAVGETMVTCRVEIYNPDGGLCARSSRLNIPIVKGGVTTVIGNFYTMLDLEGMDGGGISIKTEFDEIVEIEI